MSSHLGPAILALWMLPCALQQPDHPASERATWSGSWTAVSGKSLTLRGRWIGQAVPGDPSAAHGSWTLTGADGKTLLSGTWSARKSGPRWRGTWSATTAARRAVSGTWTAQLSADPQLTIGDLLERATRELLTGAWQSGGWSGSWWLEGKPKPASR